MNINGDVLTASMVLAPLSVVMWYFFRRWVERMERIEHKIDSMSEFRMDVMTRMVGREEHDDHSRRIHQRIDENFAVTVHNGKRIARIEGRCKALHKQNVCEDE